MATVLFEDIFNIKNIDPEGKIFNRVSRYYCISESFKADLTMDINNWIYPMKLEDKFRFTISKSIINNLAEWQGSQHLGPLADSFDYIVQGTIYRLENLESSDSERIAVFASFGGLLMKLCGDYCHFSELNLNDHVYVFVKLLAY